MQELKILGDSPTTEDGLGFDPYVNILLEAINNFDATSPLTIGIHGSWGSGKTSLMRMLEKRFEDDNSVKTIWFNAWAHGREEPIGLALLQQVLVEFQKEEQTKEKFVNVSKSISKLFAIEYTFPVFYKDVVKYREQDFLCRLEKLAKGKADEELRKELEESETLQKYHKNEDLKRLLIDKPFFCGIDIRPYIYLYGKPPEEVLVFDESVLEELLSGDGEKIRHAASVIEKMPDSVKEQYVNMTISKLSDDNKIVRWRAARALGHIGDARVLFFVVRSILHNFLNVQKSILSITAYELKSLIAEDIQKYLCVGKFTNTISLTEFYTRMASYNERRVMELRCQLAAS
jgi:ABC-type dipeptide/oligopeptide/nickel transport system ATPase subunit